MILDFPHLKSLKCLLGCPAWFNVQPLLPLSLSMSIAGRRLRPCQLSKGYSGGKWHCIRLESFSIVPLRSLAQLPGPAKILQCIVQFAGHVHNFDPHYLLDVVPYHLLYGFLWAPEP